MGVPRQPKIESIDETVGQEQMVKTEGRRHTRWKLRIGTPAKQKEYGSFVSKCLTKSTGRKTNAKKKADIMWRRRKRKTQIPRCTSTSSTASTTTSSTAAKRRLRRTSESELYDVITEKPDITTKDDTQLLMVFSVSLVKT